MNDKTLDFSGRVALVTDVASGMGFATSMASAEAGAAIVLADFRENLVMAEAEKLVASGHTAITVGCDVSDDAQVAAMVDRSVAEFGRLDAARCICTGYGARVAITGQMQKLGSHPGEPGNPDGEQ